ncbi:membrane spanning protein in TonB-ExbB-ExbD complex [uncultured Desulfobacterium sp.]|uniref:Membrane spanning protein in TonB-ExbB-ExbD complex n=1 Tax=uncultured Desulfobacterium sp. TaxID=201089 RepID=A0A445MT36_9BACT|nr:membrane spanning protein in TonB-ExbB-ExbD complex [uncultured Desulfobacterium sp.]
MAHTGDSKSMMSDINVTPFVDVMLVLLIIFMVTAPMMTQGVEVNLPQTTTTRVKTQEDPLILTVNKAQEIFIETHRIMPEDLEIKTRSIFENRRDKELLLKADRDVPYGFIMQVVAKVKKAGVDKLGMVTEPVE